MTVDPIKKLRGEHSINIFVSYELKSRISMLAEKYDRTIADIVRMLVRLGIPIMEGFSQAEEEIMKNYIQLFCKIRKARELKKL